MSVDVSVVVPVYNTARFLSQCVDSLVNQTLKSIELIFVDDGSTDNSVEILEQYQANDERIIILRQDNLTAGAARNNGMKHAKGKYIIFLDSDDYFDLTLLEKAFRCAEKNRAEIVFFRHYHCDLQTGVISRYPFWMRRGVFSGESLGNKVFFGYLCVPWNRLCLRSFIENYHLVFQPIHKHNDVYFGLLSVALAERIACIGKPLVYHRINNPESLQGRDLPSYPYLNQVFPALKRSLKALGRFQGSIRDGYNQSLSSSIQTRARAKPQVALSKDYYTAMKRDMIPELFDSFEDFPNDAIIPGVIYRSMDYENYLFLLLDTIVNQQNDLLSEKSFDYIVGHALLAIPRFILYKVLRT